MVIALVGAGGKTTLGNRIAKGLAGTGRRVLFTTTTKIYPPEDNPLYLGAAENIRASGLFMTAAKEKLDNGKLKGYSPEELAVIAGSGLFNDIIVEADGAARKPIKAPNETEPVYPLGADLIIGVIGLDCIGRALNDSNVHRSALFSEITGAYINEPVDFQHILRLISHPEGLFRYAPDGVRRVVFLNKCDTINETVRQQAEDISSMSPYPVILTGYNTDWFETFSLKFL
jgi:probable selenium-dependent hydroxylase accessory protein YqeC